MPVTWRRSGSETEKKAEKMDRLGAGHHFMPDRRIRGGSYGRYPGICLCFPCPAELSGGRGGWGRSRGQGFPGARNRCADSAVLPERFCPAARWGAAPGADWPGPFGTAATGPAGETQS